ncbi:MAG: radical SAM protein [Treponema sp.]|jgi:radical SAM superfamily enzyme YgiQ (UPF0313 family)|nr:radical SAM protein [Treponema sp.]
MPGSAGGGGFPGHRNALSFFLPKRKSQVIYLIQPPLVQLNSPYPAVYYLRSFLEKRNFPCAAADHSIALFEKIFCPAGLEKIFARTRETFEKAAGYETAPAENAKNRGSRYDTARFLSEEERWRSCIGRLTAFLRGQDREWGHLLALANGVLPSGPRFDAAFASFDGQPPADTAPLLAGKLLADLAGFIAAAVDSAFALVRYQGNGAAAVNFAQAKKDSSGYILRHFYAPWLEGEWDKLERAAAENGGPLIIGISIPFPGCLAGALACAESARRRFGGRLTVIAGGGFVNTELRFIGEKAGGAEIFDYFDYLSFDKGYGSLEAILKRTGGDGSPTGPLYKTVYRDRNGSRVITGPGIADGRERPLLSEEDRRYEEGEREAVRTIFPNYDGTDFSRYCYPVDDVNPMHRLWSDGHWLKAYLAYGCYWHACSFCDVTLDYIRNYEPVDPDALFAHLLDQVEKTGIRGVHLVDEAAPVASLLRFAELNREAGLPLVFWGNIRFEKDYTPDAAAILAAGGLLGVSAGIEVATEKGFARIGKGITLKEVIRACAAFKEQGILTHAYLIYGYWDEDEREIIDSAEILRQLFDSGLLDSAFWHQFVLSCHSRLYAEWRQGRRPGLKVIDPAGPRPVGDGVITRNDLAFEGEERFRRFTEPLDRLLAAWLAGDTGFPVTEAFPFKVPAHLTPPDLVLNMLDEYARDRDASRAAAPEEGGEGRMLFLGSRPVLSGNCRKARLEWHWRLENHGITVRADAPEETAVEGGDALYRARRVAALLVGAARSPGTAAADMYRGLCGILGRKAAGAWRTLRKGGLAFFVFSPNSGA